MMPKTVFRHTIGVPYSNKTKRGFFKTDEKGLTVDAVNFKTDASHSFLTIGPG